MPYTPTRRLKENHAALEAPAKQPGSSISTLPHALATSAMISVPDVTSRQNKLSDLKPISNIRETVDKNLSSNLGEKLVGDVLVAAGVTFAISPFLTIVDKAIVQRAAGTHSVVTSSIASVKNILRSPKRYVKSPMFLMMWGVYCSTYATANCLKTVFEHRNHFSKHEQKRKTKQSDLVEQDGRSGKMAIFLGTTVINSATSLLKDRAYATMFGTSGATRVPMITYGLWASRDCMVIGSSFVLPEMISTNLQETTSLKEADALRLSQLACPIVTQFIAGPVQLLGLDFYNRPMAKEGYAESFVKRVNFLGRNYASVVMARVARIAPAYSIGGVGNTYFRDLWRQMLIKREAMTRTPSTDEPILKQRATRLVGIVAGRDVAAQYSADN